MIVSVFSVNVLVTLEKKERDESVGVFRNYTVAVNIESLTEIARNLIGEGSFSSKKFKNSYFYRQITNTVSEMLKVDTKRVKCFKVLSIELISPSAFVIDKSIKDVSKEETDTEKTGAGLLMELFLEFIAGFDYYNDEGDAISCIDSFLIKKATQARKERYLKSLEKVSKQAESFYDSW